MTHMLGGTVQKADKREYGVRRRKSIVRESRSSGFGSRLTPEYVEKLKENEVYVFGSDLRGVHCGGTAYEALCRFGAKLGQGTGRQGCSYAIPTIVGGIENIRPYVDEFLRYAEEHGNETFLVTKIGCGIAGFTPEEIAPLFRRAPFIKNVKLPKEFWDALLDDWL